MLFRSILEYTDKLIRVQTKLGKIHILGRGLQVEYYTNDEMKVVGHITAIEFHEGDTEYKVSQNYFTTPIRFHANELNLDDLHRDGIKIWKTWTFKG